MRSETDVSHSGTARTELDRCGVHAQRVFGQLISSSGVGGDVSGTRAQFALLLDARVGALDIDGGADAMTELYVESSTVQGSITSDRTAFTDVYDSTIFGGHSVARADEGTFLCHSEVDQRLHLSGNGETIVGDGTPGCGVSYAGEDVAVDGQAAGTSFVGTIVRGDLACDDKAAVPSLTDVRVRGAVSGQCADAASADADDAFGTFGIQSEEASQADDDGGRDQAILDRVEERRAER